MHAYYEDIRRKIAEEPKWYDCHGVPRYDVFNPRLSPNIYAEEIILLEISCQDCRQKFLVEMNWSVMEMVYNRHTESFSTIMRQWMDDKDRHEHWPPFHYGDPPAHGCVGDTMNCFDLRIVEFWVKDGFNKVRKTEWEVELEKER